MCIHTMCLKNTKCNETERKKGDALTFLNAASLKSIELTRLMNLIHNVIMSNTYSVLCKKENQFWRS